MYARHAHSSSEVSASPPLQNQTEVTQAHHEVLPCGLLSEALEISSMKHRSSSCILHGGIERSLHSAVSRRQFARYESKLLPRGPTGCAFRGFPRTARRTTQARPKNRPLRARRMQSQSPTRAPCGPTRARSRSRSPSQRPRRSCPSRRGAVRVSQRRSRPIPRVRRGARPTRPRHVGSSRYPARCARFFPSKACTRSCERC